MSAEDCRARPGYYTDGLPKISDEIVEKAAEVIWLGTYGRGASKNDFPSEWIGCESRARDVLAAVLPDIERPLREEIEALKAEKAPWSKSIHELARRVDEAEALLAERDKEIEALRAKAANTEEGWQAYAEIQDKRLAEREAELAERDKEIKALKAEHGPSWMMLSDTIEQQDKEIERLTERLEAADLRYEGALRWVRTMSERLGSEHAFPPAEIEALLEETRNPSGESRWYHLDALGSARSRLKKMHDE